jgi:hypothetical protein
MTWVCEPGVLVLRLFSKSWQTKKLVLSTLLRHLPGIKKSQCRSKFEHNDQQATWLWLQLYSWPRIFFLLKFFLDIACSDSHKDKKKKNSTSWQPLLTYLNTLYPALYRYQFLTHPESIKPRRKQCFNNINQLINQSTKQPTNQICSNAL